MNLVEYWQHCSKAAAADVHVVLPVLINESPEVVRSSARTEMTNAGKRNEWLIHFLRNNVQTVFIASGFSVL